jgi:hypothetical protein
MKLSFLYCRFNLSRPGPTGLPEPVGGFVLGVPQKSFEDAQAVHPSADAESLFRAMILPQEWVLVGRYLRVSLEPMPAAELTICGQEADETKNQATFEGIGGKRFWVIRKPRNPSR